MLQRVKLSTRIILVGLLPVVGLSGLLTWLQFRVTSWAYEAQREKTRNLVQSAWGVLDYYGSLARSGQMTTGQAEERAKQVLENQRYGRNGYFWINDLHPTMVMHPTTASLNGRDLSDYKDPNGVRVFVKMVEVCTRAQEGRVEYMWIKPGSSDPVPKISYVKLYQPWGWIVGSGVYVDDVRAELRGTLLVLLGTGGLVGVLALLAAFLMARSIASPIQEVVTELVGGADRIAGAAAQISASSESLAQGASQQAASLQETSAASEEITSITHRTAETSQEVAGNVTETSGLVANATRKVAEMTECMSAVRASGDKIIRIIKSIDDIAFQTNILALNAAVEAARAGGAGLGFAVVADEVRNLAQRSASAARETATLIEESVCTTRMGGTKLEQVAGAVSSIATRTARIQTLVAQVHKGSQEQSKGIEQVSKAIVQMEQVTQRTAAGAEEGASASEEMSAQAESLRSLVRRLEDLVHAERGRPTTLSGERV